MVMANHSLVVFDERSLDDALADGQLDFDSWTSLISNVEIKYSGEIDKLSLVYDSFLSEFPLCCGYWRKYAGHKARLCSVEEAVEVYEKAVESASFAVDIWVDYCSFAILIFEDPFEVSRLFRRGLSFIGKDYLCHALWDKYIEFEVSQKQWCSLTRIYLEALKSPTKRLHQYYDSFKKLVTIWEEEAGCDGNSIVKLQPETRLEEEFTAPGEDEISCVINDLSEPCTRCEALKKYSLIGECLYQRASQLDLKIDGFEKNVRRTYFHVEPLDDDQLENWHHYLDFVEMNGDFDWAVKLYERCLIPCVSYSEFWMRYVDYVESKGGREIANDALERAVKIFLKDLPAIHFFNAGFKEQIGDVCGARTAFLHRDLHSESSFIEHAIRRANMEKRLGNNVAAYNVYKEALDLATKEMSNTLPVLYIHYSRLKYVVTNNVDAARNILIDGIRTVANCKLLLEELLTLAVNHEGARQVNILDPIIADVMMPGSDVSRGLSCKDRIDISELYLKFIDMCGTIHESRRAWNRHLKLFPHSMRTYSSCLQLGRTTQKKNFTVGTHDSASVNPIEETRIDNICPVIQLSPKEVPCEDGTSKEVEESQELVWKAADIDPVEDHKSYKDCDMQKEQMRVSGRDELPSLDMLSLNEQPDDEPHHLVSSTDHGCQEASTNCMLEPEQNVEPLPGSSLFNNAQVDNGSRIRSPQCSKAQKDQEGSLSPSHNVSPQRQSSRRYSEDQRYKEWSDSPPLDGSPHWSEGKHHEDRPLHSQRRRSRWSMVEQGEEHSHSLRQRFSPDRRGAHSTYSDRHHENHPMHYDNSRGQRGRRMQAERRGSGSYPRRGHNVHNQRFTPTSHMQPSAQPGGYPSSVQYPMQSSEQYPNIQSSQTYNQMWQYYYYYQQQQQLMLMQQQQAQSPQSQPQQQLQLQLQQQTQQQLQSQMDQMQALQLQYQQLQQVSEQPRSEEQQQTQQQLQSQTDQMQVLQLQYQQLQQQVSEQPRSEEQQQTQQQLQSQTDQMQVLQLQYQQLQQQVSEQPRSEEQQRKADDQQPQLQGDIQTQQRQLYQQMQMQMQQQQIYQQMQLQPQQQGQQQQEQSYQAEQAQQQHHQMQIYQYQQQYLLYLQQMQQLQQQAGGILQAQLPQQQPLSAEKEELNELQLQLPRGQQDGDQENEGPSAQISS